MRNIEELLKKLDQKLESEEVEQEEMERLEKAGVFKVLGKLVKKTIVNPVLLWLEFVKLDKLYRKTFHSLFGISVESGPEGSFVILTPEKARALANRDLKRWSIINSINLAKLRVYCFLVNQVNERELTKPSQDMIMGAKFSPLSEDLEKHKGKKL